MNNIFTDLLAENHGNDAGAEFFLATVASVDLAAGVTIIPDGDTSATTKKYKILTSGNSLLAAGDRVVVMRHSGTCIVLGKIGTPGDLADFVKKTGDTMSGNLTMDDRSVFAKSEDFKDGDTVDSSGAGRARFYLSDKDGYNLGYLAPYFNSNGDQATILVARRHIESSDTDVANSLYLYVAPNGTRKIVVSEAKAWRAALGLGTSGNLPITVAQGGTGTASAAAHSVFAGPNSGSDAAPSFRALTAADIPNLTAAQIPNLDTSKLTTGILPIARGGTAANGVSLVSGADSLITAASGFTFTSADYAQWGKIAMLHVAFNATAADTSTSWKAVGTVISQFRRPMVNVVAQGLNGKTYALMTNGNIQVTGAMSVGSVCEVTFTYLLSA